VSVNPLVTAFGQAANVASIVVPVVIPAGPNLGAIVGVSFRDLDLAVNRPASISSVALSSGQTGALVDLGFDGVRTATQYSVVGVTPGAVNLTVSFTTPFGPATVLVVAGIVVAENVYQLSPAGFHNNGAGLSAAISLTLGFAPTAGSLVVDTVAVDNRTLVTLTVDPAQTEDWNGSSGSLIQGRMRGAGSERAGTGAAFNMQWSLSGARSWAGVISMLTEAPPPSTGPKGPIYAGVIPTP
jgi:hypothetical protein